MAARPIAFQVQAGWDWRPMVEWLKSRDGADDEKHRLTSLRRMP
jgi:hypothetical protein